MNNYELFRRIAKVITDDNERCEQLFDYIIHSMDDNGFLRSRAARSEKALPQIEIIENVRTVLIAFDRLSGFNGNNGLYNEKNGIMYTELKMVLYPYDLSDEKDFASEAKKCWGTGFPIIFKIMLSDIEKDTVELYELQD